MLKNSSILVTRGTSSFEGKNQYLEPWLRTQLEKTYSNETLFFDKNNEDPVTLTSRIYELTRYVDYVSKL